MARPMTPPLTRRTFLRLGGSLLGLSGIALLVACGEATVATSSPTPLTVTLTTALSASTPASAAVLPTVPPSIKPSVEATTATMPPFDGLPQGRTPDGFFVLGSATAPVTLIDYSDFL